MDEQQTAGRRDRVSVVREGERENLWFLGDLLQPIITSEMTEGRFEMHRSHLRAGSEPPLHEHQGEDEIFYILDGRIEFWAGEVHTVLGPGDSILMPKDVPHIFRVLPESDAHFLVITAPGEFEKFLRAVSEPAEYPAPKRDWQMDEATRERLHAAAEKYGITILAPPGSRP